MLVFQKTFTPSANKATTTLSWRCHVRPRTAASMTRAGKLIIWVSQCQAPVANANYTKNKRHAIVKRANGQVWPISPASYGSCGTVSSDVSLAAVKEFQAAVTSWKTSTTGWITLSLTSGLQQGVISVSSCDMMVECVFLPEQWLKPAAIIQYKQDCVIKQTVV